MTGERETASEVLVRHGRELMLKKDAYEFVQLCIKQERERRRFFVDQAERLNEVDFDWDLPEGFRLKYVYTDKGLVIEEKSDDELWYGQQSILLVPGRGLVNVNASGQVSDYPIDWKTPHEFFQNIEAQVTEIIIRLQAAKVPA